MVWDIEYRRQYHRDLYRRKKELDPSKFKRTKAEMEEEHKKTIERFSSVEDYLKHKEAKRREKYPLTPKVDCKVCGVPYTDTEGRKRQHDNTIIHRIAQSTLDAHGVQIC